MEKSPTPCWEFLGYTDEENVCIVCGWNRDDHFADETRWENEGGWWEVPEAGRNKKRFR